MMPATTETVVSSSRPSSESSPTVRSAFGHEARVGQDRLPRQRPDQVGHEEGGDHGQEQRVAPLPAAEGDHVGQRIADQKGDHRGQAGVHERAEELLPVVGDRVRVIGELPAEQVALFERARLERLERHVGEREGEEDAPASQGPGAAAGTGSPAFRSRAPTGSPYAPIAFWNASSSWRSSSGLSCRKMNASESVLSSGKISWFVASAGSRFARISCTPSTGQM